MTLCNIRPIVACTTLKIHHYCPIAGVCSCELVVLFVWSMYISRAASKLGT